MPDPAPDAAYKRRLYRILGGYSAGLLVFLLLLSWAETRGLSRFWLGPIFMFSTVMVYAGIGIYGRTTDPEEYYVAGRRIPALFNGMAAAADWMSAASFISLAGGLSQPNGDLSNGVGSGYNATLGFNFGAPLIPVGARIEGGLNGFNYKGGASGDVRIMNVTANGIFNLGMPYLIGGLG